MMIFGREIASRIVGLVIGGIVLLVVIGFALTQCQGKKTAKKEAEVASGQAGASIDSGVVAVETASNIVASDTATDAQVAAAQAEIKAAAKGQKGKAAQKAACRFKAYANSPQCKEPSDGR